MTIICHVNVFICHVNESTEFSNTKLLSGVCDDNLISLMTIWKPYKGQRNPNNVDFLLQIFQITHDKPLKSQIITTKWYKETLY